MDGNLGCQNNKAKRLNTYFRTFYHAISFHASYQLVLHYANLQWHLQRLKP